ncbi:Rieske (2Fe-2S) protein [Ammoniphilus sp. 3BR4]|uniref:Rieske (2Fe-2S) protein n=1 Tax=Ammoniphilus sp. 3BR4 TaxID=3158265 RepID=UPI0034676FE8
METIQSRELKSIVICSAEELKPGQRKLVELDGVEIAMVNVEGKLYAFRNQCPHQGVPMVQGLIGGAMLPSEPGQYIYGCDDEIVRCPLHGWEFDMKTGKSLFDPDRVSIMSYGIQEVEGSIVLNVKKEPKSISLKNFACNH